MKNRIKLAVVLCFMLTAAMFAQQPDLTKARAMIEDYNKQIVRAMMMNDMETIFNMYTPDAYSLPSYSPMVKGIEQMRAQHEAMSTNAPRMNKFELKTVDVYGDGKYLIEIGNYDMEMMMPQQPEPMKDNGKYITVWEQQQDGSLKIKTEMWNTDINMMASENK